MKHQFHVAAACLLLVSSTASVMAAPRLPFAVLFGDSSNSQSVLQTVLDVRKDIRETGQITVINFDPGSSAVIRASREQQQPLWVKGVPTSDSDKAALASAMGADYAIVISRSGQQIRAHLVAASDSSRTWDTHNKSVTDLSGLIINEILSPVPPASSAVPATPTRRVASTSVPALLPVPLTKDDATVIVSVGGKPVANTIVPITDLGAPNNTPIVSFTPTVPLKTPIAAAAPDTTRVEAVQQKIQPSNQVPVSAAENLRHDNVVVHLPIDRPIGVAAPGPIVQGSTADSITTVDVHTLPATTTESQNGSDPSSAQVVSDAELKRRASQLASIQKTMARGDSQMDLGNVVDAIGIYRQAINDAPFAIDPRIRLANAYLQAGMQDQALSEAQRAIELSPNSKAAQDFLIKLDLENGDSVGAIVRYKAILQDKPDDPAAHIGLGDAYWNSGRIDDAKKQFQLAETADPINHSGADNLARLLASKGDFQGVLSLIKSTPRWESYPVILRIIQNQTQILQAGISTSRDAVAAQLKTRAEIYATAKDLDQQAQHLSDFVGQIVPSPNAKLSHLHRIQSVDLLAQETAVLVRYLETNNDDDQTEMNRLEKSVATEVLTAHAAEVNAGLWPDAGQVNGKD